MVASAMPCNAGPASVPESRTRSGPIGNCEVFRVVTEDGTFRGID